MNKVYAFIAKHDHACDTRWTILMGLDHKCYVAKQEHLLDLECGTVVVVGMLLANSEAKEVCAVENAERVYEHGRLWKCLAELGLMRIPCPTRTP